MQNLKHLLLLALVLATISCETKHARNLKGQKAHAKNQIQTQSQTQTTSEFRDNCVIFFQHCYYQGYAQVYCPGDSFNWNTNDDYSSVKLGKDVESLTVYQHGNKGGDSYNFVADHPNFIEIQFNDIISDFEIHEAKNECVTFYQHTNYQGYAHEYCFSGAVQQQANDQYSSVKLGKDVEGVTLFQHYNEKGRQITLFEDTPSFFPQNFNDIVSSFEILKKEEYCVTFFKHVNYQGKASQYCESGNVKGSENDIFSSVKLGSRVEMLSLFEHYNKGGVQINLFEEHPNFIDFGFNDVLSSFEIVKEQ